MQYVYQENSQYPHVFGTSNKATAGRFLKRPNETVTIVLVGQRYKTHVEQTFYLHSHLSDEMQTWLAPYLGTYRIVVLVGETFEPNADKLDYHLCFIFKDAETASLFRLSWT